MSDPGRVNGLGRIAEAFSARRPGGALMPYMMGGFPTVEYSLKIGRAYVRGGADLIEFGLPFSDPLADGPAIQAAGWAALKSGATVDRLMPIASELAGSVPVVVMTYANIVRAHGIPRFLDRIHDAGCAGLIVPDQPVEESDETWAECDRRGVALIQLVAPTTTDARLETILDRARGFVYVVSVAGVTGERSGVAPDLSRLVKRVRSRTDLPIAVGFGISSPAQAREVSSIADGVIVGSRLVRAVADSESENDALAAVEGSLREMSAAIASPRG